ncbi:MAG TPA: hypothetical protein VK843_11875 [Planctomycetota bacterium]|nr:hypothetical protein [Planctomycetota bacterium]
MKRALLCFAVATAGLDACVAVAQAPREMEEDWRNYDQHRREESREWLSVAVSSVDRRGSDEDLVDDSAAFTLEGGYDVFATQVVRAGFEIGVVWSRHEVEQVSGTSSDPKLSVARWNLGVRVALESPAPLRATLWADGGVYIRDENSSDEPDIEQNGGGSYVGGGLDFWFDESGRMGPFIRYYDFRDSDLDEVLVGLSATFSL